MVVGAVEPWQKLVSTFSLPLNASLGRVVLIKAMQELREGEATD
jgi:hypothetical protein